MRAPNKRREGVCPYEYMETWDRFTDPNSPQRKLSAASSPMRISMTRTTPMRKRRLQQPVLSHRRPASGRCVWDGPKDMPPPVRPRPRTLLHQPGPFLGRPTQRDCLEWSSSCSQIMTSTCSSKRGCAEVSQWSQCAMPNPTIIW